MKKNATVEWLMRNCDASSSIQMDESALHLEFADEGDLIPALIHLELRVRLR